MEIKEAVIFLATSHRIKMFFLSSKYASQKPRVSLASIFSSASNATSERKTNAYCPAFFSYHTQKSLTVNARDLTARQRVLLAAKERSLSHSFHTRLE